MKIPEGWKLVPVEPTEEMLREMTDGFISVNGDNRKEFRSAYPKMLAAAPTPPAQDVEPVAWHVKRNAFKDCIKEGEFYGRDEAFFNDGFDAGRKYTQLADDKLRKAAEEYMNLMHSRGGMPVMDFIAELVRLGEAFSAALVKEGK